MRIPILVACGLAMIFPALAAESTKPTTIVGTGIHSCGAWTGTKGTLAHNEYEAWVLGFVTAYNEFALSVDSDVGQTTDGKGMLAWVDLYCAAHPLDTVAVAAARLIGELQRRSGAR